MAGDSFSRSGKGYNHNWTTFAEEFLEEFCARFPRDLRAKAPPGCEWIIGPTLGRMEGDFRRAETPFTVEIERVIRTICGVEGGDFTIETSREVAYFLGLRGGVVASFLMDLDVEVGPKASPLKNPDAGPLTMTIIPFPMQPAHKVMQWLLIDWWREHGPWRACLDRLTETVPLEDEHGRA
jgi:hypothetical protein